MKGTMYSTTMNSAPRNNQQCYNKRNGTAVSIGLQTMYSHQQHTSRYSMLPHSRPHMTMVKEHPLCLKINVLNAYGIICDIFKSRNTSEENHPFSSGGGDAMLDAGWCKRLDLRKELLD
jgi:hypothetical protein